MYVYNVYRSQNAGVRFISKLKLEFDIHKYQSKCHIIMGDWNFCVRSDLTHPVKTFLESEGFIEVNQLLEQTALPTHLRGRTIDQAWFKKSSTPISVQSLTVRSCLYSDHEKIEIILRKEQEVIAEGKTDPSNNCIGVGLDEAQKDDTISNTKHVKNFLGLSESVTTNELVINGTDLTCKICPKSYKVFHHLQTHYKTLHSKNLLLGCSKCKAKFEKKSFLNNHKCKF